MKKIGRKRTTAGLIGKERCLGGGEWSRSIRTAMVSVSLKKWMKVKRATRGHWREGAPGRGWKGGKVRGGDDSLKGRGQKGAGHRFVRKLCRL